MLELLADHLWQSTLFAGAVAILARMCRENTAAVRHRLWLAASLKFVVPFALLTSISPHLGWLTSGPLAPESASFIEVIGQPFSVASDRQDQMVTNAALVPAAWWPSLVFTTWLTGTAFALGAWLVRWQRVSRLARRAVRLGSGRTHDTLRTVESIAGVRRPISIALSDGSLEPGVFGVRRPLLLWPRAIDDRLDGGQLEAVMAHEVAHVQRHDNLAAIVHMSVEALFWFHPMVWWIGARLVDERERACDEAVVGMGHRPDAYAEGILRTCRVCVESPLPCVAGINGADLRGRVAAILRNAAPRPLDAWRKTALGGVLAMTMAVPLLAGAADDAPSQRAGVPTGLRFEVVSVKRADPGERGRVFGFTLDTGRLRLVNLTLESIVRAAYGVEFPHSIPEERMAGGPEWMSSDRFTIEATAGRAVTPAEMAGMLRTLLAERFGLVTRVEPRDLPVFHLMPVAPGRLGPNLRKSDVDCKTAARCGIGGGPGRLLLSASPMSLLAETLNELTDRPVFDRSGHDGSFDGTLEWAPTPEELVHFGGPDAAAATRAPEPGASLFTALRDQFGLRLVPARGPVDFLIIDRASHPSEN